MIKSYHKIAPQSLRGESQQLRGVIFNSRMNRTLGDLFLLCYRMMAFGDRNLKRYFTNQGELFSSNGHYLFPLMVLLLPSTA